MNAPSVSSVDFVKKLPLSLQCWKATASSLSYVKKLPPIQLEIMENGMKEIPELIDPRYFLAYLEIPKAFIYPSHFDLDALNHMVLFKRCSKSYGNSIHVSNYRSVVVLAISYLRSTKTFFFGKRAKALQGGSNRVVHMRKRLGIQEQRKICGIAQVSELSEDGEEG